MSLIRQNNQIIKSHGAFFPESGKCVHLDRAFWVQRASTGWVERYGRIITARTLREAPWNIQRTITECSPFIQSYDNRPWARKLEEQCIKVYTGPMDRAEIIKFINIARAEGWTLQYREYNKMHIGHGDNICWMWLFSTKNVVNDIIKQIHPDLHKAWKDLPPVKKMARTSLIMGSWKVLEAPGHRPFKVGILPIDTKGWGLIKKDILRLNGIMDDVVKAGLLMKSILRGVSDGEAHHILKSFGVELTQEYISNFDLLIGKDEDKFKVIGKGQCLEMIAWNPDHTPANICTNHANLRWDARLIDGHRPEADLSEIKQILARNKMNKEETVKWLGYKSGDHIDIRMGAWLAYLGYPLNMCNPRIFWESVGARIKSMFWMKAPGFTGTLLDERLAPVWMKPVEQGCVKLPPALMADETKPKIWFKEGVMFVNEKTIDNFHRDNDGDLGQWIKEGLEFTVDGTKWDQKMPEEIEHKDTRRMPEALADQLGNDNFTGIIHSQHMILMSIARYLKKGDKTYRMLMNSNRFFTEKFIMRNKYNMTFETPPSLYEMALEMDFPWWRVKRERAFASVVRTQRVDQIVELAKEKVAKKNAPFFENIAWQMRELQLSEDEVDVKKDEMYQKIDRVRRHGFVWLKRDTIRRYAGHEGFNKHEFMAGLDKRKSMYKVYGPHMKTEDIQKQRENLAFNMDRRFTEEVECLKKLGLNVTLLRACEMLLANTIIAKEFEYSTYLWNRYWEKEEVKHVTGQDKMDCPDTGDDDDSDC